MSHQKRLAILVGGGPAPGINSVIGAATIRGVLDGVEVLYLSTAAGNEPALRAYRSRGFVAWGTEPDALRSGGVAFAAQPRNYEQKVNRKMYQGALRSILSELVRQERLVVVDDFSVATPKTKELVAKLRGMTLDNVLLVSENPDENLYLAARNLHQVEVCPADQLDPVSLVGFDQVLMTTGAIKSLEGRLA